MSRNESKTTIMKKMRGNLNKLRLPAEGLFFARWLAAPHKVGALIPASRHLARAMAEQIVPESGLVVELGAGTGSVTRALIAAGLSCENLVVVERDPAFCRLLTKTFPGVSVLCGDALRLRALLAPLGIARVGAIVSSLPLLSMPGPTRQRIVEECFALLPANGMLVQYTYGAFSPLRRRKSGLKGEIAERVWRNFPPAAVWRFRRRKPLPAA